VFYYLGLEASLRENKYYNLPDAEKDALHACKRMGIPIRIFCMKDNNKSHLISVVHPNAPCGEPLALNRKSELPKSPSVLK
jgi:hypothetical protein